MKASPDSSQANVSEAKVQARSAGRRQINSGTSEIRRMPIGRELFAEML